MSLKVNDSQLFSINSAYLNSIYEDYLSNPNSVDISWRAYFDEMHLIKHELPHNDSQLDSGQTSSSSDFSVLHLIDTYRRIGHKFSNCNPLNINKKEHSDLDILQSGLNNNDLKKFYNVGSLSNNKPLSLKDIILNLKDIYTQSTGYEYMHLDSASEISWISEQLENKNNASNFSDVEKTSILNNLTAAESLEKYLGMRYVGQKRFSLEGGESVIPALLYIVKQSAKVGVKEICLGMSHRGRLNVLVNVMGKLSKNLFNEFEGYQNKNLISGDVKYHLGFASWYIGEHSNVRLSLAFNPSHLEAVNPVVLGAVRAKQECYDVDGVQKIIPILLHGDSSFCGQGVVMETFALSNTRFYGTGGAIHIVINNQIGFTTSKLEDNRSSVYCTDIAHMVKAPVLHVNSNDPEAVIRAVKLAMDYRMLFNKDVVLDIVCYRKHGHNETDEPSMTQPKMYSVIKQLPSTRSLYLEKLKSEKCIDDNSAKKIQTLYLDKIKKGERVTDTKITMDDINILKSHPNWRIHKDAAWDQDVITAVDKEQLINLANKLTVFPKDFVLQKQVKNTISERVKMSLEELKGNWGFVENLTYATLLSQGYNIRLSGEDTGRGTFSHRHAVFHNYDHNQQLKEYIPLQHVNKNVNFTVIDSILSEYGVLGFEYGYSCVAPESLVIWEAQFGDFANTAQVIIDQFIAAAEEKWGMLSGLVLLLPHGQEGAGAEHSSARLERFLQLCANDNIQVCTPTTPAQFFHMLRRQMLRLYRKPLVVMSPKSLLRHKLVVSSLDDLSSGHFYNVIDDFTLKSSKDISRVLICSGKIYYDIIQERSLINSVNIAIIRLEQLYPFPIKDLTCILSKYQHVKDIVWVQEEPKNQGPWSMISDQIMSLLTRDQKLSYVGRKMSSASAVGCSVVFRTEQQRIIREVLKV